MPAAKASHHHNLDTSIAPSWPRRHSGTRSTRWAGRAETRTSPPRPPRTRRCSTASSRSTRSATARAMSPCRRRRTPERRCLRPHAARRRKGSLPVSHSVLVSIALPGSRFLRVLLLCDAIRPSSVVHLVIAMRFLHRPVARHTRDPDPARARVACASLLGVDG